MAAVYSCLILLGGRRAGKGREVPPIFFDGVGDGISVSDDGSTGRSRRDGEPGEHWGTTGNDLMGPLWIGRLTGTITRLRYWSQTLLLVACDHLIFTEMEKHL